MRPLHLALDLVRASLIPAVLLEKLAGLVVAANGHELSSGVVENRSGRDAGSGLPLCVFRLDQSLRDCLATAARPAGARTRSCSSVQVSRVVELWAAWTAPGRRKGVVVSVMCRRHCG
jgi:hypothetical protein